MKRKTFLALNHLLFFSLGLLVATVSGSPQAEASPVVHKMFAHEFVTCAVVGEKRELWCWGKDLSMRPKKVIGVENVVEIGLFRSYLSQDKGLLKKDICYVTTPSHLMTCLDPRQLHEPPSKRVSTQPLGEVPVFQIPVHFSSNYSCMIAGIDREVICLSFRETLGPATEESLPKTYFKEGEMEFARVSLPLKNVKSVTGDGDSFCALKQDSSIWCWGNNLKGSLGLGTERMFVYVPQQVKVLETVTKEPVVDLVRGSHETCALVGRKREMFCWGLTEQDYNNNTGSAQKSIEVRRPADTEGVSFKELFPFGTNFGGITLEREWYNPNSFKETNLPILLNSKAPHFLGGNGTAIQFDKLVMGGSRACILADQRMRCVGMGIYGALGYGNEQDYGDDQHETWDQLPYVEFNEENGSRESVEVEAD